MKKILCIFILLFATNINAEECFNASQISKKAAYVAAPDIEAAIISSASDFGWLVEKAAAKTASYAIVGQLGVVQKDDLIVCVTLNNNGKLALLSYPEKMGKKAASYRPLKGTKK